MPDGESLPKQAIGRLEKLAEAVVFAQPELQAGLGRLAAKALEQSWEDWDEGAKEWAEQIDTVCHGIAHLLEGVLHDLNSALTIAGIGPFPHDKPMVEGEPYLSVWDSWNPLVVRKALRDSIDQRCATSQESRAKSLFDEDKLDAFITANPTFELVECIRALAGGRHLPESDVHKIKAFLKRNINEGRLRRRSNRYEIMAPRDTRSPNGDQSRLASTEE